MEGRERERGGERDGSEGRRGSGLRDRGRAGGALRGRVRELGFVRNEVYILELVMGCVG